MAERRPVTSVSVAPTDSTVAAGTAVTYTATASDAAGDSSSAPIDSLSISPNGAGTGATCTATTCTATKTGSYTVTAVAAGMTATSTLTVSVPDTTIDSGPPSTTPSSIATFEFHGTPAPASYECSVNGAPFAACTSPTTYPSVGDGPHTFQVRALDAYGNADPTPASYQWTVDSTPGGGSAAPETTITSGPADGSTSGPDVSFGFAAVPATGATFECSLDRAVFATCSSPQAYTALTAGSHTFAVRATDSSGNTDATPATRTWTVANGSAPAITGHPASLTGSRTAGFSFTGPTGASFECSVDGKAFAACTSPVTYTGLKSGSHTFTVRTAGTTGTASAASYGWAVDTIAPQTKRAPGQPRIVHTTKHKVSIGFTGSDNRAATADLTYQCSLDGGAWTACTSPVTLTGLADGQHRLRVRATDTVGNTDQTPIKVLIAVHHP